MTELETVKRAKMYMDKLAQGIDPITDCELPNDSALNNVRLARCFFYVSDILRQVIDNGGQVGEIKKTEFVITAAQLASVQPSSTPIPISEFTELLMKYVDPVRVKKLSATKITNWLIYKGFLAKETTPDGRSRRLPTPAGHALGMLTQMRHSHDGREYLAVYYDTNAQQFLLDNLHGILLDE